MKVILFKPYGECPGVRKAIELALNCKKKNNEIFYTFGQIAHNEKITKFLEANNIFSLKQDFNIDATKIKNLLFTAHGYPIKYEKELNEKGVNTYKTTCIYIEKIYENINKNKDISYIYVGDINHIEGKLFNLNFKNIPFYDLSKNDFVEKYNFDLKKIYHVINQTTIEIDVLDKITSSFIQAGFKIKKDYTICPILRKKYADFDYFLKNNLDSTLLLVGSKTSNNTKTMKKIARKYLIEERIKFILNLDDLKEINFKNTDKIIIASGTSTLKKDVEEIYNYLTNLS